MVYRALTEGGAADGSGDPHCDRYVLSLGRGGGCRHRSPERGGVGEAECLRGPLRRRHSARAVPASGSAPLSKYDPLATPGVVLGDERAVPPDHPDSNARMVQEELLAAVPVSPEQVHRLKGERAARGAAADYEEEIRRVQEGDPPMFDLILLGMGVEGHTASLFPGSTALHSSRLVEAVYVEKLGSHRLTITPRLINAARRVVFLVAGRDKANAVREVLQGPRRPDLFPAQAVEPTMGCVTWFLDREAASLLRQGGTAERNRDGNVPSFREAASGAVPDTR